MLESLPLVHGRVALGVSTLESPILNNLSRNSLRIRFRQWRDRLSRRAGVDYHSADALKTFHGL